MNPKKIVAALILLTSLAFAQEAAKKTEPAKAADFKMKNYQMVFMYGTEKAPLPGEEGTKMQGAHLAFLNKLNKERKNLLYGPMLDGGNLRGICVVDAPNADAAKAMFADEPFISGGYMRIEVRPWFGPDNYFHEPAEPLTPDKYIFGFLVRGSNREQLPKERGEELQKGHLGSMDELYKQGKLSLAGPFMDNTDVRGIVVYKVATVEEAQKLAAEDPLVKIDRLKLEAHPWLTWKGILQ